MSMGHNGGPGLHAPSFDSVVADLLASGAVLAVKEWYDLAMVDKRLGHGHRVVMVEIATAICANKFPTQEHLTTKTGYTLMTLRRIIADLTKMNYLVSARRQQEPKKPAVAQYAIRRMTAAEYQSAVEVYFGRERKRLQTIAEKQPQVGKLTGVSQVDGRLSNQAEYTNARTAGDIQLDKRQSSQFAAELTGVPHSSTIEKKKGLPHTPSKEKLPLKITNTESVSSSFNRQPSVAKSSSAIDWRMLNPHNVAAATECAWVKSRLEVFGEFRAELLFEVGGDETKLRAVLDAVASYGGKETATGLTLQRYVRSKFSQAQRWFEIDQAKLNRGKPSSVKDETPENRAKAMLETPVGKQMVREMGHEKAKEFITKKFQESAR